MSSQAPKSHRERPLHGTCRYACPDGSAEVLHDAGKGGPNGGVQWGMASDGKNVYAAVSDLVRTRKMNDDREETARFTLKPAVGGGLTALRLEDGQKVWYAQPLPSVRPGVAAPHDRQR
jgi:hypothetical protein